MESDILLGKNGIFTFRWYQLSGREGLMIFGYYLSGGTIFGQVLTYRLLPYFINSLSEALLSHTYLRAQIHLFAGRAVAAVTPGHPNQSLCPVCVGVQRREGLISLLLIRAH